MARRLSPQFAAGFAAALLAALLGAGLAWRQGWWGERPPPAPEQPLAFSHRVHAGDYGMDCLFCHGNAARAPAPSLPAVRDCMVCHWSVGEGSPEVAKLVQAFEEGEPIRWRKVVRLPEHVQFNHAAHVRRGIDCAACHGRVEEMDVTREVRPFTMGLCVECHWKHEAPDDCLVCHH